MDNNENKLEHMTKKNVNYNVIYKGRTSPYAIKGQIYKCVAEWYDEDGNFDSISMIDGTGESYIYGLGSFEKTDKAIYSKETNINNKTIYMIPDYNALFWNEEGCSIGNAESITLNDNFNIQLSIPGLNKWLKKYENEILIPCETGKLSVEKKINYKYDWNSFHKEGIRLAYEVRKLLPDYITLYYDSPYEYDCRGIPHGFKIFQKKKLNKLSFKTENVCLNDCKDGDNFKYKAFYYYVDGDKLEYGNQNPLNAKDICETINLYDSQERDFENERKDFKAVLLDRSYNGYWECYGTSAQVIEDGEKIRCRIHSIDSDVIIQEFVFLRDDYYKVINEVFETAKKTKKKKDYLIEWADGQYEIKEFYNDDEARKFWKETDDEGIMPIERIQIYKNREYIKHY